MRPYLLLVAILLSISLTYSQSKKELTQKIIQLNTEQTALLKEVSGLKDQILQLTQENSSLKVENENLKAQVSSLSSVKSTPGITNSSEAKSSNPVTLVGGGRCQAITQAGKQCSRNADAGSSYCWQHKSTYEPTKQSVTSTGSSKSSGTSTTSGRTIYTGPRGGRYYINSKGNKVYVKK